MRLSRSFMVPFALATIAACGSSTSENADAIDPSAAKNGFHVSGRFLYDKCDNKVVLRGVNEMIVWSAHPDGSTIYPEIAKTGANVVRIVWSQSGSASVLDATIKNALAQNMIPMVENHDATGDLTKVPGAVNFWVGKDVVEVLKKYQDKVLLNIANEAGASVVQSDYESAYTTAISRLRAVGYTMPLVIDAPGYGANTGILLSSGPALIAADPLHNVLLSTHAYWQDPTGDLARSRINDAVTQDMPMIVGEFADLKNGVCTHGSFNVSAFMDAAQQNEIGWLAWSWGAVPNTDCPGGFDMTSDGTFAGLKDWGLVVATSDANSIKNTSKLDPYIVNGSCN